MAEAARPGGAPAAAPRIGLLGGTFDPVHNGHLRTALEVVELLGLDELRLVPVNSPALRAEPAAPPAERLAMLSLASAGEPRLRVDDRELRRGGVSYSIDTLRELRHEIGDAACLCMVVGEDAFAGLERWKEWRLLLDYAHIAVLTRPGDTPAPAGVLAGWTAEHLAEDPASTLAMRGRGRILRLELTQLAISSTQVRGLLRAGRPARYLVPDAVLEHIQRNGLYGSVPGAGKGGTL